MHCDKMESEGGQRRRRGVGGEKDVNILKRRGRGRVQPGSR